MLLQGVCLLEELKKVKRNNFFTPVKNIHSHTLVYVPTRAVLNLLCQLAVLPKIVQIKRKCDCIHRRLNFMHSSRHSHIRTYTHVDTRHTCTHTTTYLCL